MLMYYKYIINLNLVNQNYLVNVDNVKNKIKIVKTWKNS